MTALPDQLPPVAHPSPALAAISSAGLALLPWMIHDPRPWDHRDPVERIRRVGDQLYGATACRPNAAVMNYPLASYLTTHSLLLRAAMASTISAVAGVHEYLRQTIGVDHLDIIDNRNPVGLLAIFSTEAVRRVDYPLPGAVLTGSIYK